MLNGLDLFSGIGGLALALGTWVKPAAYCEIDRYCQGVLLSRMSGGELPYAPIWDDVRTLTRSYILGKIDIIYGGFPCQDISVAGDGKGLAGERSGLVFEIFRLVEEIRPTFIFMENVPAIRTRGAERVVKELASIGYDCRWGVISAFDVGAPHQRDRWFLGAYNSCIGRSEGRTESEVLSRRHDTSRMGEVIPISKGVRCNQGLGVEEQTGKRNASFYCGWEPEPNVGRVANGVPFRVDRIKGLGNAVVPSQAREAFKRLIGLSP